MNAEILVANYTMKKNVEVSYLPASSYENLTNCLYQYYPYSNSYI